MNTNSPKKTKRARWMLYIPAILLIVFFVWIVKIAFDMVAMGPS